MFYVYSLSDPRNGDVRYVGKTIHPKTRWAGARPREKGDAGRWYRALYALGLRPIMQILEQCDDKDVAITRERWWMDRMWWRGEPLLNVRWGEGPGCVISPISSGGPVYRAKIGAARKQWLREHPESPSEVGKRWYQEHPVEGARRKECSPELRAKLRTSKLGQKKSAETRERMSATMKLLYATTDLAERCGRARLGKKYKKRPAQIVDNGTGAALVN